MSEKLLIQNNSNRDFRWAELEISAGDTVEIYKEQMERIPVLQKLLNSKELELVGACGEQEKENSHINSAEDEKAQENSNDAQEEDTKKEVKKLLKDMKGKKK